MSAMKCPVIVVLLMAGYLFAEQHDHEKISLAVNDLTAEGVKENESAIISEQLRTELAKFPTIQLVERSQMQEILKEQGFQKSGCINDACAVEIGQLLGVKNIVVGSVGVAGSYTVLSVRVIDVGTGNVIVNESVKTKGGIDIVLESGIAEAAGKLNSGLFPQTAYQIPTLSPSSVKTVKEHRSPAKAVLIGSGAAVLIGGITAAILLNKDESSEQPLTPNTRIELP